MKARGEQHGRSKLTESQVIRIRLNSEQWTLARWGHEFGVSTGHVWNVREAVCWKHVK